MVFAIVLGAVLAAGCPSQESVLRDAAAAVQETYVDPGRGRHIAQALSQWADSGRYVDTCEVPASFVEQLNADLDAYDGHFHVEAPGQAGDPQDWLMAWRADAGKANAGVREVRVLEGNVGYLRLSTFYPWDVAGAKIQAAFSLLADSGGLILDLRQNGGGDAGTAEQLVRTFLADEVSQVQRIEQRGTVSDSPLPRRELEAFTRPLVVLVDRRTGSAAEFVAYSLQVLGRAKVVGSRTGGAASLLGEPVQLSGGYRISIPYARPVNRVSGASWEKLGVRPDVPGGDDPLFIARMTLAAAKQ
ncbi:S41 family peptidase [Luteimonas viscosa]|uniref:S41 family peptidase n=1 Tax=Luteimonas viscosa TaxID=1132694 RepID=A0A5D4XHN4_9GAMM|nr:S41 family peptidase [Luteimonas viscosa]TYT23724.1 S41 family peptidase [Luteimonas viscosa]